MSERAYLGCPCCGDEGAVSEDGLFHDGQELVCGCDGYVSIDDWDEENVTADVVADECRCGEEAEDG